MGFYKDEYWNYYEYCRNGDRKEFQVFYKSGYLILAYLMNDVLSRYEYENIFRDDKDDLRKYDTKQIFYDDEENTQNKSKIDLKMEKLDEIYKKYKSQLALATDQIKTVYWGEEYEKFVNFTKENGIVNMNDLFGFDFKQLYGTRGFNYVTVNKIVNTLEEWINISLYNSLKDSKEDTYEKESDINTLVEEFFF